MSTLLKIGLFIGLMEYQILQTPGHYSPITILGLIGLCLIELHNGQKGFKKEKNNSCLSSKGTFIIILIYVLGLLGATFFFQDYGQQFLLTLSITAVGIVALSFYEFYQKKSAGGEIKEGRPDKIESFTIPVMFVYVINHLLSVQVDNILAHQFIIVLSAFVLYDIFRNGANYAHQYEKGQIDDKEFHHYLFHRWSKYLNYFLGIWYFFTLSSNGIITEFQTTALIFTFSVIFLTFISRMVSKFTIKDFFTIVLMAGILTSLDPLIGLFLGMELTHFLRAIILFLFFDLCDIYMHSKNFKDENNQIWGQKAVVYILVTLFVIQLHILERNSDLSIENAYSSLIEGNEISTQMINVEDEENSFYVRE
jgi:hypothetical protein